MALRHHEIPTHLNVEDRAFFGLSVRQFTDLIAGLAGTYSLWNTWPDLPVGLRISLAVLSLLVTAVMSLAKPGGRRVEQWLFVLLHFLLTPRRLVWCPRPVDELDWRTESREWAQGSPTPAWSETRP